MKDNNSTNYHQVIENSQKFTDLNQIKAYMSAKGYDDWAKVALQNTIGEYELNKIGESILKDEAKKQLTEITDDDLIAIAKINFGDVYGHRMPVNDMLVLDGKQILPDLINNKCAGSLSKTVEIYSYLQSRGYDLPLKLSTYNKLPSEMDVAVWLNMQEFQTDYDNEQNYRMYYGTDMPKIILGAFKNFINKNK